MSALEQRRRFYAEEIRATSNVRTEALVDALATVPREHFLRTGPWLVRGEGDFGSPPRETPNADPAHVYHNYSVAIDAARSLFNGGPGIVAMAIDALELRAGQRVLHVGTGLGYYSAVVAHVVGATGSVVAIEVDETLAREARRNLSTASNVEVKCGDGSASSGGAFDAILVSAGVTHPCGAWLDTLAIGGRMAMPLTAGTAKMGPVSKGPMLLLTKIDEQNFAIRRVVPLVSAYSAVGLRDDAVNEALGKAFMQAPFIVPNRLRRDAHEAGPSCWLHAPTFCFSSV